MDATKKLHTIRQGHGSRLVLVHGFTQTARCWGSLSGNLAADHEVVAVDAPGHGGSSEIQASLSQGGDLIAKAGGAGTYIGYSMGGRFVLHSALQNPQFVHALVLIGATAGLRSPQEQAQRRQEDEQRAQHIENIGVSAFLEEWLRLPLFGGLPPEAACIAERETNTAAGLASSLRLAGTGTQEPSWDRLGTLAMPTLVIAGEQDTKFMALGKEIAKLIGPNATFGSISNAGHTAHLEQPEQFNLVLRQWLLKHGL